MAESTPEIVSFKDIQEYQDFFTFFDAKFQVFAKEQVHNELVKIYQISRDEKVGVQVSSISDPSPLKDCTYSFILFPKNGDSLDYIRIYGTLIKKDNSLQLNSEEPLDRLKTNNNLIKLMDSLTYIDQSVNPHFILFPLDNKQKFIYGDLKRWKRTEDGKLNIIDNLADKVNRIRQWEEKHPPKKVVNYPLDECKKAKCSHYTNNACEYAMTPNNKSEYSTKLQNAKGYCSDYIPKSFGNIKSKLTSIFTKKQNEYKSRYQHAIELLEDTLETKFDHNVMAEKFDKKKFSALIYLVNHIKPDEKQKTLQYAKEELNEIENKFDDIISLGEDLFFRIIAKKGYIKAKQEFEHTRNDTISELDHTINRLFDLKTRLEVKTRLISELFTKKLKPLTVKFEELSPNQAIYFQNSTNIDYYSNDVVNIGRIKDKEDNWKDHTLALSTYYLKDYEEIEELEEYPIYRVKTIKKSYVEIQEKTTKNIIRLLPKRVYTPYILFRHNKYIPTIKNTSQVNLTTYHIKIKENKGDVKEI